MNQTVQSDINLGSPSIAQSLGRLNFGDCLVALTSPTIDSANRTVSSDVHEMTDADGNPEYGIIQHVHATAGGTTGPCAVITTGVPATGQVKLEYTAGRPKLTFAAAAAVTGCRCHWIKWPMSREGNRSLVAELQQTVGG